MIDISIPEQIYEFEKNLEIEGKEYLNKNGILCSRSRELDSLSASNVQVMMAYGGALEDSRCRIDGVNEYDLHEGTFSIIATTYRQTVDEHLQILGQIRNIMRMSSNPWKNGVYAVYEVKPMSTDTVEDEEQNIDQSTLYYQLKWGIKHLLAKKLIDT
jgi:hypothetical protein